MTLAVVVWALRAVLLALWVMEHLVLMVRGLRRGDGVVALAVPEVGAWRAGQRFAAVRYGVWVVGYLLLALVR